MDRPITKRIFADSQACPKDVWLRLHKPELLADCHLTDFEKYLMEQGNVVEEHARNLFPHGVEVKDRGEAGRIDTIRLMEAKTSVIFQATFIVDGFIARNDMLVYDDKSDCWDLYEVKSSSSGSTDGGKEQDQITDISFQAVVMKRSGVKVGKYFLIRLNKEYVRHGELSYSELFKIDEETEKVLARMETIEPQMEGVREYLSRSEEPGGPCDCLLKSRTNHCATFAYSNPQVPTYGIHDISRVTPKKLNLLVERGIFSLADIPEDFELTDKQRNQVDASRTQTVFIDHDAIRNELSALTFPLHFLDFEFFGPAIPMYDGFCPYKQIPFQFSLHTIRESGGEIEHVEYLHEEKTDPTGTVGALLQKHLNPKGTTIAWSKPAEAGINKQIAERAPAFAAHLEQVNASMYDLMDIFRKQHYIHAGFEGRTSIKNILPTLAPDFTYEELEIQKGDQAANAWFKLIDPNTSPNERAQISSDLKAYCGRDSEAMVVIWKHLCELVA